MAFGIDCADTFYAPLAAVRADYGEPAFIGRYLPTYPITVQEVADLKGEQLPILPLWNGMDAVSVGYGYDYGYSQGVAAAEAWRGLGMPGGCAVFLDVEQPWCPSGIGLAGWLDGTWSRGMVGGAYLNPRYGNGHAAAWQYARNQSGAPGVVFSSQNEISAALVTEFSLGYPGAEPVPGFAADTVLYQTWENVRDLYDLDCISTRGLALLWAPHRATATTRLVVNAALKEHPDHSCRAVADLAAGCTITFDDAQGHPLGLTPHWARVAVLTGRHQNGKPAKGLLGWLLRADLETTWR